MKKTLLIFIFTNALSFSQGNIYPRETNYGGGVGLSTMYMVLDSIPGQALLDNLGGEGLAQMSGPWRRGGYAGIGSSPVSKSYEIKTYEDKNGVAGYQSADEVNEIEAVSNRFRVNARVNFLMGAMTFEYVIPIYRDLEVTAGTLMGMGGYSLTINESVTPLEAYSNIGKHLPINDPGQKHHAYLDGEDQTVYVDINNRNLSAEDLSTFFDNHKNITTDIAYQKVDLEGFITEKNGYFFNFQPYIAVKWQFLDRMGLRISAGFNKGLIKSDNLKTNGITEPDETNSSLHGLTVRTVLYFGL